MMPMTPGIRKLGLTLHITSSVSWFGAVAAFLALALIGVMSRDAQIVRAAYMAMPFVTWFVIVPLSIAAFLTGVVQSVGTTWGLFRHYWVVMKLLLTILATFLLLLHTRPIDTIAAAATSATWSGVELWTPRLELVGQASAALFVLFGTTVLSVYKPWGVIPFAVDGQRTSAVGALPARLSGQVMVFAVIGFMLVIVLLHLVVGGMHGH